MILIKTDHNREVLKFDTFLFIFWLLISLILELIFRSYTELLWNNLFKINTIWTDDFFFLILSNCDEWFMVIWTFKKKREIKTTTHYCSLLLTTIWLTLCLFTMNNGRPLALIQLLNFERNFFFLVFSFHHFFVHLFFYIFVLFVMNSLVFLN